MKNYDMKLNILIFTINMIILNDSDNELEAHKSVENQIYRLRRYHKLLRTCEDLSFKI